MYLVDHSCNLGIHFFLSSTLTHIYRLYLFSCMSTTSSYSPIIQFRVLLTVFLLQYAENSHGNDDSTMYDARVNKHLLRLWGLSWILQFNMDDMTRTLAPLFRICSLPLLHTPFKISRKLFSLFLWHVKSLLLCFKEASEEDCTYTTNMRGLWGRANISMGDINVVGWRKPGDAAPRPICNVIQRICSFSTWCCFDVDGLACWWYVAIYIFLFFSRFLL